MIAGDICPRLRVNEYIDKEDFFYILGDVKDLIASADFSIVNFESPVVDGTAQPINKQGPSLRCTSKTVMAIKWTGFKCATLANNHFFDYGQKGVEDTINALEAEGIDHVGGGLNLDDSAKILYKDISGKTLAIINCCEHEFSIATETTAGCNPLNPVKQYYSIKEAKCKADYVLVIVHGGHEMFQLPSPRMIETYRFFIEVGADAVVNHHQHCYSGYEFYHGCPILYGLGNFLFDTTPVRTDDIWNYGMLCELSLSDDEKKISLYPYSQCAEEPRIKMLPLNAFDKRLKKINDLIAEPKELRAKYKAYCEKSSNIFENILEPFQSKLYMKLKRRGLLPSFINKRSLTALADYVLCESHRDKFGLWLEKTVQKK